MLDLIAIIIFVGFGSLAFTVLGWQGLAGYLTVLVLVEIFNAFRK